MGLSRLLTAAACLAMLVAAPVLAQTSVQILRPSQLPAGVVLFNPLSGATTSLFQNAFTRELIPLNPLYSSVAPLPGVPLNEYGRMSWHSLEPREGVYDFSIIDHVLEPCPAPPGRTLCLLPGTTFSFRIMPLNPQT